MSFAGYLRDFRESLASSAVTATISTPIYPYVTMGTVNLDGSVSHSYRTIFIRGTYRTAMAQFEATVELF